MTPAWLDDSDVLSLHDYSSVTGAVVNQFIESFDAPVDPYARAALRFSPFFMMSPQPHGHGLDGLLRDPRLIGAALVAGIVVVGVNHINARTPHEIRITAPSHVPFGQQVRLVADVVDARGVGVSCDVRWMSSNPSVAVIDAQTGLLSTPLPAVGGAVHVVIRATVGDITRSHLLTVSDID